MMHIVSVRYFNALQGVLDKALFNNTLHGQHIGITASRLYWDENFDLSYHLYYAIISVIIAASVV